MRIARKVFDISLADISAETDLTIPHLSRIESGDRLLTADARRQILAALARLIQRKGAAA